MCGSSSTTRRCRRTGDKAGDSGSEQAGDRPTVAAQVVEQGAHVGGRPHQNDQQGVGVEDGHDSEAGAELEHAGAEWPAPSRFAQLGQPVDDRRQQCGYVVCVDSVGRAGVNRQPVTPHDHHGVHAAAAGECLDHIPDCRHTAAKLGMETSEVKQPPWVDPLGRRAVSSPHRMPSPRRFVARFAPLIGLALLVAACGDTSNLPAAFFTNVVDTVSLYALRGTALTLPSAYVLQGAQLVRTDQTTVLDFAFDFDSLGAPALFPTGAMKLGTLSGLQRSAPLFDAIKLAPTGGYTFDQPVTLDTVTVVLVRSRPTLCSFGATLSLYAKLRVLGVDSTARRVRFEILVDQN